MAIPNPNPNIRDYEKSDNFTWSSNKINDEIDSAKAEIPTDADIAVIADTEIKDYLSYGDTEKVIGKWIDGSDLYEKAVTFGALPSGSTVGAEYTLGITGVDKIIDYSLIVSDSTDYINLPFYSSSTEYVINGYLEKKSDNSIVAVISVGTNRSSFNENKAIVRYTKA